jgi:hypothetical protein
MLKNIVETIKKKSLTERFLLVIRILVFLFILILGIIIMFWKSCPFVIPTNYKWVLGLMLVYSLIRIVRFFNANKE